MYYHNSYVWTKLLFVATIQDQIWWKTYKQTELLSAENSFVICGHQKCTLLLHSSADVFNGKTSISGVPLFYCQLICNEFFQRENNIPC